MFNELVRIQLTTEVIINGKVLMKCPSEPKWAPNAGIFSRYTNIEKFNSKVKNFFADKFNVTCARMFMCVVEEEDLR